MPFQAPSWTEFYTCPICENEFSTNQRLPISLGCGHTICRVCLGTVYSRQCPFDQTSISTDVDNLPINNALLQLLNSGDGHDTGVGEGRTNSHTHAVSGTALGTKGSGGSSRNGNSNKPYGNSSDNECVAANHQIPPSVRNLKPEDLKCYKCAKKCIEELAQYLKSFVTNSGNTLLTRPMLRKLITLVNCQLMEEEGRIRAVRTARFLGERTVTELLLQHQNPQQLSLCLWAAVRSRGCQFLGPSMQEEVLKLVLQALQNGSALSRKVLVMYVVQRLIDNLLPASKTSIGHVVQLLYRASCFKVSKREGDSSLMQLKEEFRNYESLRREHDAQIVQIATEAGLRIAPDQWSSLLYGNTSHKSHMQSICDTLQTPSSFAQSVQELVLALQRTGDPTNLSSLRPHLKHLASIDPLPETAPPTWQDVEKALEAVRHVVLGLVKFMQYQSNRKVQDYPMPPLNANGKYKISLCRDLVERRMCPRGTNCTFAHSAEERQRYRAKHRRTDKAVTRPHTSSAIASSSSMQALDSIKNDFSANHNMQHNTIGPPQHLQQQNQTLNNSADNGNSPVRLKPSPMRKYNNNNDITGSIGIIRPNMMETTQFIGDLSATPSPLNMQASVNAIHASPLPSQGHMLSLNAPGSIINVPPMQKQHPRNFENMPPHLSPINYGGNFLRLPNMRMSMIPNLPNLRGPISSGGGMIGAAGGGQPIQGIQSPRSSVHNPNHNITTVANPPNLQGTTANKPPGSPLHRNIYNNTTISVDIYNTCPPLPSYFTNSNMDMGTAEYPYRLTKQKIQKPQNTMWDVASHQPQQLQQHPCQNMLNHAEFSPNHHHQIFVPQPPPPSNQHQQTSADPSAFYDKNYNKLTPKSISTDNSLQVSSDSFIFKPSGPNKTKPKMSMTTQINEKSNMYWHLNNNNNQQQTQNNNNHFGNGSSTDATNIEQTSSSLFRDRDSFVRSDSILDDDAATFDVTPTSTGNKYGPICPMYKGLASSLPSQSTDCTTTNTFVDSWNALISQTANVDDNQCNGGVTPSNPKNIKDFTVFSLDDGNALNMQIENHSSSDHFNVDPAIGASNASDSAAAASTTPLSNYDDMQAAFSKLSFINDSTSEQQQQHINHFDFDLNSMYNILGGQNYHTEINKNTSMNDDLLWNNSGVSNAKTTTMTLGLDSFWSDDASVSAEPTKALISSNIPLSHQHRQSQKLDDTELDITEIVDHIWPCGDDSGIKLD